MGDKRHVDDTDSPMANIHNRRDGELLSKEEAEKFVEDDSSETHRQREPTEDKEELDEEEKKEKIAAKYAKRYSKYW